MSAVLHELCPLTGKRMWTTAAKAWLVATHMTHQHKHHTRKGRLHAWRCKCCGRHHVGHEQEKVA